MHPLPKPLSSLQCLSEPSWRRYQEGLRRSSLPSHSFRRNPCLSGQVRIAVGNELTPEITDAIKTASVHVAIFSKNYAESYWCLKELVLMVESRVGGYRHSIFYGVEPSSLRRRRSKLVQQAGTRMLNSYRNSKITRMKTGSGDTMKTLLQNGKRLFKTAANLTGLELETACNGYEGELVEKIVKLVSEKVIKTPYNAPKYENIGLDVKVKEFEKVLLRQQQNGKHHVVGIEGSGGVGKTTLAKEFFHTESPAYRNSCFFPVRRIARTIPLDCTTPLDYLFEELFVLLSGKPERYKNVDVVKKLFKENNHKLDSVKNNPSLVILDGVENDEQAEKLLSIQEVLHSPGGENDEQAEKMEKPLSIQVLHSRSLILITSRYRDVLTRSGVEDALIYKLNGLDAPWSGKLFCLHAFHQAVPSQGYEYLVGGFVGLCNGLPLLLEVFGAFIYGKNDRSYWEDLLDKFQQIHPREIEEKLKFIYDRLDVKEQHVFLDIARFFIGESTQTALTRRKGSGWTGSLWLQTLVEKRLVEVDRNYGIEMHHHLEDLGNSIAKKPREPRPLWPKTDNYADLLQESHGITELRRNIDALSRQSSVQSSMILTTVMMMMAMKIWNMRRRR